MIQDILDEYLKQERSVKRVRAGLWSPSSFGRCFRNQFWTRKDEPPTNPPDALALRQFKRGKLVHDFIQGVLVKAMPNAEHEVEVKTSQVHTFVDIVTEDEAIEIKSQRGASFTHTHYKSAMPISEKCRTHFLQAISGAYHTDKDFARLIYVNSETLQIKEYRIPMSPENVALLDTEFLELNKYWPDTLPPAIPRAYLDKNGVPKDCQYCAWRDKCNQMELGERSEG